MPDNDLTAEIDAVLRADLDAAEASPQLRYFARNVLQQQRERYARDYPKPYEDGTTQGDHCAVRVHRRKRYTLVDVGPQHNISGRYMIDNETDPAEIFGIKGYGKVHRGHRFGTLDTVDAWAWGDYRPRRLGEFAR